MSWFSPYRGLEEAFNIFCVQGYEDVLMVVAAFRCGIAQDVTRVGQDCPGYSRCRRSWYS